MIRSTLKGPWIKLTRAPSAELQSSVYRLANAYVPSQDSRVLNEGEHFDALFLAVNDFTYSTCVASNKK